jgi:hypothetical protein
MTPVNYQFFNPSLNPTPLHPAGGEGQETGKSNQPFPQKLRETFLNIKINNGREVSSRPRSNSMMII